MHLNIEQEFLRLLYFDVRDAQGKVCYQAEVERVLFSFAPTVHVYDRSGKKCATVKQKLWHLLPTFEIYIADRLAAAVKKQISFLSASYDVSELSWNIEGEFLRHEYTIAAPWGQVASISRRWFTWGDCYDLDVPNPSHALTALCLCLAVDMDRARGGSNK